MQYVASEWTIPLSFEALKESGLYLFKLYLALFVNWFRTPLGRKIINLNKYNLDSYEAIQSIIQKKQHSHLRNCSNFLAYILK